MNTDTASPNGLGFDPELAQKALQVLAEQGGPDDIAAFLQERGITGLRAEPARCPVAVYLRSEVLGMDAFVARTRAIADGGRRGTKLPKAVSEFTANFDCHHYPLLNADVSAGGVS